MTNEEYKQLSIKEFTEAAKRYEGDHAGLYEMCKKDYPDILEELEKESFIDLLDAGCGPAPMISLLSEKYPDRHYTGLDLTPAMIEEAKKKNIPNAVFVVGDCENFPFEENSFDAIICSMSFHHYPNPQAFFNSVKRCLPPKGRLILRDVTSDNKPLVWLMNKIEMPLANLCGHRDVQVPTRDLVYKCCKKENPKIKDEMAVSIVKQLDYDFSQADQDKTMRSGVIARTIVLDKMVDEYLDKHKNTIVINIACGLDTRCYRMKGKYIRWYNLDLPETINIRKQFLPETGPIYQIAKSAMDETYTNTIHNEGEDVLVIIEGLTMYLTEIDIKKIFSIIEHAFSNVTIMVEVMSPFMVKHIKEKSIEGSHAKFTWGIKNGKKLEKLTPSFSFLKEVSLVEE